MDFNFNLDPISIRRTGMKAAEQLFLLVPLRFFGGKDVLIVFNVRAIESTRILCLNLLHCFYI